MFACFAAGFGPSLLTGTAGQRNWASLEGRRLDMEPAYLNDRTVPSVLATDIEPKASPVVPAF
jgi:hypothetical protein